MKKLVLLLLSAFCLGAANAQDVIKAKKKTRKAKTARTTYTSRNGTMKAEEMTDQQVIDSAQKAKINAPQVNHGVNENMPPLSPSNGNGGN